LRSVAEPQHEVDPPIADPKIGSELTAQRGYFHRLIDEGIFQPEGSRLQAKALTGASRRDPMRLVVRLRDKDCNTRRAFDVFAVLPVFLLLVEKQPHQRSGEPGRHGGVA
jgi:hypothetical protein